VWDLNIQFEDYLSRKIDKFNGDLEAKFQRTMVNTREVYKEKVRDLEEKSRPF